MEYGIDLYKGFVYVIDLNTVKGFDCNNKKELKKYALKYGKKYTFEAFEEAINNEELFLDNKFIKII